MTASTNQPSYHNTTSAGVQLVIDFESKAKAQEAAVLKWFGDGHTWVASPSGIYDELIYWRRISKDTPLTSIRRAITNLTKKGYLRKTNIKVTGKYGRKEYCWERV
jgi:hypothetical protein